MLQCFTRQYNIQWTVTVIAFDPNSESRRALGTTIVQLRQRPLQLGLRSHRRLHQLEYARLPPTDVMKE